MDPWADIQIRVHGDSEHPTLVYFPGLHGDWTLIGSFRAAVGNRLRFVELSYPRTQSWSLEEHSAAILAALRRNGIREGWILAESFGSILAWDVLKHANEAGFEVQGIILAGGFVRYPIMGIVRFAQWLNQAIPMNALRIVCGFYARYAKVRHRQARETLCEVGEFVRRRTEPADRSAICYRYTLIRGSDARQLAMQTQIPIYHVCGFFDPIVPWLLVRRWLKKNCKACKGLRIIWRADHNVLGTAPRIAAEQVVEWIGATTG